MGSTHPSAKSAASYSGHLDNEFIRVCVNLMQEASDLLQVRGSTLDFREPLTTPIFENLRSEMLCLPENEIDVLCTFYGGLDATRRLIRDETQAYDLKTAEEVARKVWPSRKVQLPGERPVVLAERLNEQAAAVAKELKI